MGQAALHVNISHFYTRKEERASRSVKAALQAVCIKLTQVLDNSPARSSGGRRVYVLD